MGKGGSLELGCSTGRVGQTRLEHWIFRLYGWGGSGKLFQLDFEERCKGSVWLERLDVQKWF